MDPDRQHEAPGAVEEQEPPAGLRSAGRAGLQRLQRVSWRSVLQVVLLVFAVTVLVDAVSGIDPEALFAELQGASWFAVAFGFVVAQTPRLAQTVSALGASPQPLAAWPVYLLQLAQGYVGLAVPTSAARVALNVRFFQKQGLSAGAALAIGGLDGFAGFIVEACLLFGFLVLTPGSSDFDLSAPSLPAWGTILLVVIGVGVLFGVLSLLLPRTRRQLATWFRNLLADGRDALAGLRSPRRLVMLIGGNLASILLFATTLDIMVAALGGSVALLDVVVANIAVSLLSGLLPVPGGIGVVESGLVFGLIAAGVPEDVALASVILYRLATFYVPPAWGFFALRALERRGDL